MEFGQIQTIRQLNPLPVCVEVPGAQKTKDAPPLLPSNHPSKHLPSRLEARTHVLETFAHLSTITLTSQTIIY
jgi:hypothetical protein